MGRMRAILYKPSVGYFSISAFTYQDDDVVTMNGCSQAREARVLGHVTADRISPDVGGVAGKVVVGGPLVEGLKIDTSYH